MKTRFQNLLEVRHQSFRRKPKIWVLLDLLVSPYRYCVQLRAFQFRPTGWSDKVTICTTELKQLNFHMILSLPVPAFRHPMINIVQKFAIQNDDFQNQLAVQLLSFLRKQKA